MNKIRDIYQNLVQNQEYMEDLSREVEDEIEQLLGWKTDGGEWTQYRQYEQYRDKLFSAAAIGEEAGFIKGFCFAAGLAAECLSERRKQKESVQCLDNL